MRADTATRPGTLLGIEREVTGTAAFIYDGRGPRVAPAIEVHGWLDPRANGVPYPEPNHVGLQAIGLAVPDLDAATSAAWGSTSSAGTICKE